MFIAQFIYKHTRLPGPGKGGGSLLKSYKTEINPAQGQKEIINKTIGTCRYVYNFYLGHNK